MQTKNHSLKRRLLPFRMLRNRSTRNDMRKYNTHMPRICIVPRVEGPGGVTSFRLKFEHGLHARGVDVSNDPSQPADVLLVLAGTRQLLELRAARRRGMR